MMRESWLPAKPDSAARARALVQEAAVEHGLDGDSTWSLVLATSEAFSNAVIHGTPCPGNKGILVRVLPWRDGLCVEVCDCGEFDSAPPPPGLEAAHGRGIPLIAAVVDHFELVPEGPLTRVRFGKRRRRLVAA
jgi:anti-sigma regulatory factor (Ser/Thr protein kinase)